MCPRDFAISSSPSNFYYGFNEGIWVNNENGLGTLNKTLVIFFFPYCMPNDEKTLNVYYDNPIS